MNQNDFPQELIDRFWSKVDRSLGENSCWLWKAGHNSTRRGVFAINCVPILAHRFSYLLAVGDIPKGLMVLHSCDVGDCVNPKHLHLGTQKDNMREASERSRIRKGDNHVWKLHPEKVPRGDNHGLRKHPEKARKQTLSPETVRLIRKLNNEGKSYKQIALTLQVGTATVARIATFKIWKHV